MTPLQCFCRIIARNAKSRLHAIETFLEKYKKYGVKEIFQKMHPCRRELIDEIIRHVYSRGSAGRNTLSSYKNQLNQLKINCKSLGLNFDKVLNDTESIIDCLDYY